MEPANLCVVTELMGRGSLYDIIHDANYPLAFPLVMKLSIDILKGLQFIHSSGFVHRDMKYVLPLPLSNNRHQRRQDIGIPAILLAILEILEIFVIFAVNEFEFELTLAFCRRMFGEKAPTGNLALAFTDVQSSTEVRHLPSFFILFFSILFFCFVLVLLFSNVSFQLWEHDPRVMMRSLGLHNEVFRTWINNTVNSFEYCLPTCIDNVVRGCTGAQGHHRQQRGHQTSRRPVHKCWYVREGEREKKKGGQADHNKIIILSFSYS